MIAEPYMLCGDFRNDVAKRALLKAWSKFLRETRADSAEIEINPDLGPWHFCFDSATGKVQAGQRLFHHIESHTAEEALT